MKTIAAPARQALADGTAIVVGAVEIASDPPIRVWGGNGPITFGGRTFDPVGDRSLVQVAGGALGGAAQSISLSLSGIEPEVLELLDADEVAQAPGTLWRMIFAGNGITLLDYHVWARGRLDELTKEEEVGGQALIQAALETAARGLGRRGGRMRTDADQRLVKADDGFFKNVAYAGEKMLYWGGRKPANAGSALGGVYVGGMGGGGGGGGGGRNFAEAMK
ncbi:MAG: hypothetical protein ACT6Q5_13265 [Sphingopyxis solisilvae]|uniref:hypothetical protein n=1 Tax=Sphingopyxis solisilvae TaxID=1886788 RepID=UPI004034FE50